MNNFNKIYNFRHAKILILEAHKKPLELIKESRNLNLETYHRKKYIILNESREREARLEAQRLMEASRNKAALDRALAPPYRPKGKRPVFRYRYFYFRQSLKLGNLDESKNILDKDLYCHLIS